MNLIFDFDGTITAKDTILQLAQSAIHLQTQRAGPSSSAPSSSSSSSSSSKPPLQTKWDDIVRVYAAQHAAYADAFSPPKHERRTPAQELVYLASLKDTENASLDRVDGSGLFGGVTEDDLFRMGRALVERGEVVVRDGFADMVRMARDKGWRVGVISVNWSAAFIQGVLHPLSDIPIVTNRISSDGTIHGPEGFNGGVRLTTSRDKTTVLSELLSKEHHSSACPPTVYFGDSTTDMECLLAHRGIVISADAQSSLMQTLARVGVRVPHVGSAQDGANIAWARDFREVLESRMLERIAKGSMTDEVTQGLRDEAS
ncbi:haloacid dehalogenase-like hydrolase domain-containing protein [Trichoderma novae-zelandiae]